jgi:hypothetical protein
MPVSSPESAPASDSEVDVLSVLESFGAPSALSDGYRSALQESQAVDEPLPFRIKLGVIEDSEVEGEPSTVWALAVYSRSADSERSRKMASSAARQKAEMQLVETVALFPYKAFAYQDLLREGLTRRGLSLVGKFKPGVRDHSFTCESQHLTLMWARWDQVILTKPLKEDEVQVSYLSSLIEVARDKEAEDDWKAAKALVDEHRRFLPWPEEVRPILGCIYLKSEGRSKAEALAADCWLEWKDMTSTGWFELAALEYRLGHEKRKTEALSRATLARARELEAGK